jgi:protein tyrosine/serine phosphatase
MVLSHDRRRALSVQLRAALAASCLLLSLGPTVAAASDKTSDGKSAPPRIDIGNFGKVNDHLYRGAQPESKQYDELKALGIKTIIDLRDDAREWARPLAERAGLRYVNMKLSAVVPPTREESTHFLELVNDSANWPVFVHCAGGRHRTGVLVAVYRMVVDGWNADRAYEEMKKFKFYTSWGHGGMKDYVYDFYRTLTDRLALAPQTPTTESAQPH